MIGEPQRGVNSSNRIIGGALQGPVSPELLLFAPQHDNSGGEEDVNSNSDGTWDWELVSHLLKAYQQVLIDFQTNLFIIYFTGFLLEKRDVRLYLIF
jgi:hypothetical protein